MECNNVRELLSLYIDNMLDDEQMREVEKHLATCDACKKEMEELSDMVAMLSELEEYEVPEEFNARFDAVDRTYLYIMKEAGDITPFEADYVSKIKGRLDVEQFREIMDIFIGKHDFKSFMKVVFRLFI